MLMFLLKGVYTIMNARCSRGASASGDFVSEQELRFKMALGKHAPFTWVRRFHRKRMRFSFNHFRNVSLNFGSSLQLVAIAQLVSFYSISFDSLHTYEGAWVMKSESVCAAAKYAVNRLN